MAVQPRRAPPPHPTGAFYLRLVGRALDIYQYLEPLLNDYRKIRERCLDGKYRITHVDEVCDGPPQAE